MKRSWLRIACLTCPSCAGRNSRRVVLPVPGTSLNRHLFQKIIGIGHRSWGTVPSRACRNHGGWGIAHRHGVRWFLQGLIPAAHSTGRRAARGRRAGWWTGRRAGIERWAGWRTISSTVTIIPPCHAVRFQADILRAEQR